MALMLELIFFLISSVVLHLIGGGGEDVCLLQIFFFVNQCTCSCFVSFSYNYVVP